MRGTVYICPVAPVPSGSMIDPEGGRFWASWQDDEVRTALADVKFDGAHAAITWARERSEIVLIRLGHTSDTYFSAGATHPESDDQPLPVWPPVGVPLHVWWIPPSCPSDDDLARIEDEFTSGERSAAEAGQWAVDRLGIAMEEGVADELLDRLTRLAALAEPSGHLGVVEPAIVGDADAVRRRISELGRSEPVVPGDQDEEESDDQPR